MILPMVQFPRTELESSMMTMSSSLTVCFSAFHFFLGTNDGNTSWVQRLMKVSTIFCTNSTLCRGFLVSLNGPCGSIEVARPRSMSLGHIRGLATSSKQVYNSNGVRTCSPIAFFRAFLVPLTNASAQPFDAVL